VNSARIGTIRQRRINARHRINWHSRSIVLLAGVIRFTRKRNNNLW
jgi:hypothetical protein